jgi:hypothetical protein
MTVKDSIDRRNKKIEPQVKDILILLAKGIVIASSILVPPSALFYKEILDYKDYKDQQEWDKFNPWRLKQILKRLEKQKVIEIRGNVIQITDKGRNKVLQYNLETMCLKKQTDGKWRIIMYDIANLKKRERELFRYMLKKLRLLQLQESVYLTPYVCEDEIEYLRQYFHIGNDVLVLKVIGIENEEAYRRYFGL